MGKVYQILADSSNDGDGTTITLRFSGAQFHRSKIAVLRAGYSNGAYQIITNFNTFDLREVATDYTVTIPPANYDLVSFAAALQTALNAVVGIANTYGVTSSASTGYITVTRTGGAAAWSFRLASYPRMAAIMGMAATDNATGAGPVVSTLPVRLTASFYYLASSTIGSALTSNIPDARRIASLQNVGGRFQSSSHLEDELVWYDIQTGVVDFFLIDEFGFAPVALNNGPLVVQAMLMEC